MCSPIGGLREHDVGFAVSIVRGSGCCMLCLTNINVIQVVDMLQANSPWDETESTGLIILEYLKAFKGDHIDKWEEFARDVWGFGSKLVIN